MPGRASPRNLPTRRTRSPSTCRTSTVTEYSKCGSASSKAPSSVTRSTASTRCTSRCAQQSKLYTWVAKTAGDNNGARPLAATIFQGAVSYGLLQHGPRRRARSSNLTQHYAISDNYHQAVQGGTGANHIALGTGAASYQNKAGKAVAPPAGEIENPNPQPGTNNNYTRTGTARAERRRWQLLQVLRSQAAGRRAVFSYLNTLPYKVLTTAARAATTC